MGRERSKVKPDVEGQCFRTHPHRDRPHPRSICYGLEKTLMRFMTVAPLHTTTQRPQMTSGRVIWPLLFFFFLMNHTLSRKKKTSACILQYSYDAAYTSNTTALRRYLIFCMCITLGLVLYIYTACMYEPHPRRWKPHPQCV